MAKDDKPTRASEDMTKRILGDAEHGDDATEDLRDSPGAAGAPEKPHREAADETPERNQQETGPQSGPANTGRNPGGSPDKR